MSTKESIVASLSGVIILCLLFSQIFTGPVGLHLGLVLLEERGMGIGEADGLGGVADQELHLHIVPATLPRLLPDGGERLLVISPQPAQMPVHRAAGHARKLRQLRPRRSAP
ncbi:hypothetical protein [Maricaulis sp.]|uniref:hypothetical protein n=1 Tax=Maricaulis sp. TaxID=1486257 RepID=UPI0025C059E8|nr:hypothetical protein [Maricaulis sp.]